MDRNSVAGIVLIAAILVVWGVLNKPNKEEIARRQKIIDSTEQVNVIDTTPQIISQGDEEIKQAALDSAVLDSSALIQSLGSFSVAGFGKKEYFVLENDLVKLTLSSKGGRPYSVQLKNYRTCDSLPLILFSGDSTIFGLNFSFENRTISTNDLYFSKVSSENNNKKSNSIILRLNSGNDKYIEYVYTLEEGSYMVDFKINMMGMSNITTRLQDAIDLSWSIYSPQQEKGRKNENMYTTIYYKSLIEDVEFFKAQSNKPEQSEEIPTKVKWVAFKDQFFSSVIIADDAFDNALVKYTNIQDDSSKYLKIFNTEIGLPFKRLPKETIDLSFYFGPNKFKILNQYKDIGLNDLVTVGRNIIKFFNKQVIIRIFDWLSKFTGNYGLIILLLTIIIKILLLPLTFRSYLSQAKMKVLKPQMDELTAKFPKGKEMERQKATMALYKKAGVSPLGGCLPMILQMPILFAMFRFFPTSIELRQEGFLWAHDLSTYDAIVQWQGNIPILTKLMGNHLSLFTILMTITTILSMKMSSQTTNTAQQMPGMKGMMYFMPIMFFFILNRFSAALTYYYFLANVITLGQNWLFKQFIDEEALLKKMELRKAKTPKKSKFQERMEIMAKKRGYKLKK